MFRKKRYVHPFISRKPVRTPLTYIQIDQICRIELGIFAVALCEEGVDRNPGEPPTEMQLIQVALCEEGVDRNLSQRINTVLADVALCEEGVDRNDFIALNALYTYSRPLRRGRG